MLIPSILAAAALISGELQNVQVGTGIRVRNSSPAQEALLQPESPIFPLQDKHVHSSSIVECPNGDFLATWFYGSGERSANDVKVQGARLKKGATDWSPVFDMADTPNLPDCNPVLFIDPQEKLWLFWVPVQANRWEQSILKYRTSTDYQGEGAPIWTWQDIILLKPGEDFPGQLRKGFDEIGYAEDMWAEYAKAYTDLLVEAAQDPVKRDTGWMGRCKPITLKNGRILLPLYSDGYNVSLVAYSDDQGASWKASGPMVGLGNIQPSLVQREDGAIVAYMRDNGVAPKRIMQSTSTDNGETWSTCTDMELPNPGASVAACDAGNGTWALVFNNAEEGRHNLTVAFSKDEGSTWETPLTLYDAPDKQHSYAYPTVIPGSDQKLHISFSYSGPDGKSICHCAVDIP
ncbi:MAG: exo-alpha-sialidase [Candidatus Hydrogenedentes bacterium]|nr:exo-alpha-sialidase [Candidatus Hydrogenedentota bacterium]